MPTTLAPELAGNQVTQPEEAGSPNEAVVDPTGSKLPGEAAGDLIREPAQQFIQPPFATDNFPDKPPNFTQLCNLASSTLGASIRFATDEWFAPAERMISDSEPMWDATLFTEYGKWMDGWETRRRRSAGHDFCIIKLARPGVIRGFDVDTAHFTGNFTPAVSIQARRIRDADSLFGGVGRGGAAEGTKADPEDCVKANQISEQWTTIVPFTRLRSGAESTRHHFIPVCMTPETVGPWTHLRLNMYPDGGIARLRAFGYVEHVNEQGDGTALTEPEADSEHFDVVAMENGGRPVAFSDSHYGSPSNLLLPGRGNNIGDGWETARRHDRPFIFRLDPRTGQLVIPGNEWCIIRLGRPGRVARVVVDTHCFRGNYPESCRLEGISMVSTEAARQYDRTDLVLAAERIDARFTDKEFCLNQAWRELIPRSKLEASRIHEFEVAAPMDNVTHVKLTIFPDGGVMRLRLYEK